MIVRFDGRAVQETVQNKTEPIGVDGDPATKQGGISEAEHIVLDAKKKLDETGEPMGPVSTNEIIEAEQDAEPGPELNPEALEAARKDKKPQPPVS